MSEPRRWHVRLYQAYGPQLLHRFSVVCTREQLDALLMQRCSRLHCEVQ